MAASDNRDKAEKFVKDAETIYRASNHVWGMLMSEVVRNYCLNIHDEVDFEKLEEVRAIASKNNYRYIESMAAKLTEEDDIDIKLLFL